MHRIIYLCCCFRLIREMLLKQKLIRGDDLKKLTDSTNENVKKINIVKNETKEVIVNSFSKYFY